MQPIEGAVGGFKAVLEVGGCHYKGLTFFDCVLATVVSDVESAFGDNEKFEVG